MREAYEILDAWGFEPKTILTWAKDKMLRRRDNPICRYANTAKRDRRSAGRAGDRDGRELRARRFTSCVHDGKREHAE
jgi:hypothetical protein